MPTGVSESRGLAGAESGVAALHRICDRPDLPPLAAAAGVRGGVGVASGIVGHGRERNGWRIGPALRRTITIMM